MTPLTCPYCRTELEPEGLGEAVTPTVNAGNVLALFCKACGAPLGFLRLALPREQQQP